MRESILQNTDSEGVYKLPSENQLCEQYHMSRQTVRTALRLLTEEGLIEKRRGSGSYSTGLGAMQNTIAVIVNHAEEYTHSRISEERKILEELKTASIRGIIAEGSCTALPNPNLDLYELLMAKGVSLLFAGTGYPALTGSVCIKDDNYYGGYLLAKHLIQLGHTRIAGAFQLDDRRGLERYHGYASAMRDFGIPLPEDLIVWYTAANQEALELKSDTSFLADLLRRNKGLYSAVICQNDEIAYWLIRELDYADIRVPDDITVVSFDNSYMSDLNAVHITTLAHEREPGTAAATALLKMIQGESVSSEELPWSLIQKNSDAPYNG